MGAGLFVRSLRSLRSLDLGFRRQGVLLAQLFPRPNGYKNMDNSVYYSELIRRVRGLPGVLAASLSPLPPGWLTSMQKNVSAAMRPGETSRADLAMVSPGFFETLGISLLRGRDFNWQDNEKAPRVAILSQWLAQQLFPAGDAIGQHINIGTGPQGQNVEVVGIVTNVRLYDVRSPNVSAVYTAVLQEGELTHYEALEVRAARDPMLIASSVRQTVESLGREYVLSKPGTLSHANDLAFLNEHIIAILSEFFGGLALLLVATGLYGLMAYSVTRRKREIGIRVALGAEQRGVLWMVMRESFGVALAGVAIGLPAALAAPRLISTMLFGLTPTDPPTVGMATLAMIGVAVLAAYLPARRASKVEPTVALRYE